MRLLLLSSALLFCGTIGGAYASLPTPAQTPAGCRVDDGAGTDLVKWVKRVVTDTSLRSAADRSASGLSFADSSTVYLVSDSTTCADLAGRFARSVAGRDTVAPYPVHAVAVGTAKWVVIDYLAWTPPAKQTLPDGRVMVYTGPQLMRALTIDQTTGQSVLWSYDELSP